MNRFSIKDIENLTGIKAHTIRIWEQRYGILQPKRTASNIRYYDAQDLKLALRISLLNNYGYKISRIHSMSEPDVNTLIQKVTDAGFKLQLLVNEMLEAMLATDTEHFELLITGYIRKHGIEKTIEELIFCFLEKVGIMWITDHIFPAQEHLVSNIIYRKLVLGLEQLPTGRDDTSPKVLLFLPEGEIHDIGLMYVNYLLQKHGKRTIYLGANSPLDDAKFVYDLKKPDYVYIHLTSISSAFDTQKYFQKLHVCFPDATILLSGAMLKHARYTPSGNMRFFSTLEEAKSYLVGL